MMADYDDVGAGDGCDSMVYRIQAWPSLDEFGEAAAALAPQVRSKQAHVRLLAARAPLPVCAPRNAVARDPPLARCRERGSPSRTVTK